MTQPSNEHCIKRVVIVGGGTAGWLAAGVLAAKLKSDFVITLIESPNVPSIGVGEGSWPSLRDTLMDIGISESEFLSVCNASYKQGSSFVNWRKSGTQPHVYHHPFTVPIGYNEIDTHACWQEYAKQEAYENAFSLQASICKAGKAPKQFATPDYAHVLNYGYHFDATALANLLKTHCTTKRHVKHCEAHIASVQQHQSGDIKSLTTDEGEVIAGDLFIDCSGSNGLLIDKHFHVPWISSKTFMLNDRAMAVQVPYQENDTEITSTTVATAHANGWTWDIGLQHRRGVGLVYSSECTDEQTAEDTLIDYVSKRYQRHQAMQLKARKLDFSPGYRQQFWVKNCLSLGMSSGFVEPLEASAIAMVELGLRMLCDAFPHSAAHMEIVRKRYNKRFTYRWQRVIDFLKLHYVLNDRDEPYWLLQRQSNTIPDSLKELLNVWRFQSPSRLDLIENDEIFPSASYQYVLYGMGFTTQSPALRLNEQDKINAQGIRKQLLENTTAYLQGLPSNRALLAQIAAAYAIKIKEEKAHDLVGFR